MEVLEPDGQGFGDLVVSTLDPTQPLPLLRYRTGDRARRMDREAIAKVLEDAGFRDLKLPALPMIAVAGRAGEQSSEGRTVLDLKDALYAEDWVADRVTGAFRVRGEGAGYRIDVQLRTDFDEDAGAVTSRLRGLLADPGSTASDEIRVWPAEALLWRPVLHYERKFTYVTP